MEKFAENVARIKASLSRLCANLQDTEFPNDVVQTEELQVGHCTMRQEFSEDLRSTVEHGEALRDCMADVSNGDDAVAVAVKHRTELRQDRLEHVDAIDRYSTEPRKESLVGCKEEFLDRHSLHSQESPPQDI